MRWKLFLDDIRPVDKGFILAISMNEAIRLIDTNGFPSFISFDHDLGDNVPTGKDFVNLICEKVLDGAWLIPTDFQFQVHSDNTVGAENIRCLLNNLLKHKGIDYQLQRSVSYSSRK